MWKIFRFKQLIKYVNKVTRNTQNSQFRTSSGLKLCGFEVDYICFVSVTFILGI